MNEREILTLQFGHYSNFVGTHLWNIQEFTFDYNASTVSEINHDTFYREGLNNKVRLFTFLILLHKNRLSREKLPSHPGHF